MLPPEIIDHILSFLRSDRFTVRQCSRAHPILSKLVQKHIHAYTAIRNVPQDVSQFSKLVSDNPYIANYVRDLRIDILIYYSKVRPVHEEDIALILPKFQMLRRITLTLEVGSEWFMLHRNFRAAFVECLRLPSMIEVSILQGVGFPLNAFVNCTSIKTLTFEGPSTYDSSSLPPQIESLSLRRCYLSLSVITSWVKTCSLRSLSLCPSEISDLPMLLSTCSDTLTSLDVDFTCCTFSLRSFISTLHRHFSLDGINYELSNRMTLSFSCLTKLENLTVHTRLVTSGESGYDSLPAIVDLVRSAPSLTHLTLEIQFMHSTILPEVDWSPLALLVSSSLECNTLYAKPGYIPPEKLLFFFEVNADLMRMVRQGVLQIKKRVDFHN